MKNYFFILFTLLLWTSVYGQFLPQEIIKGKIKTVKDSVLVIDKSNASLNYQLHKNEYHHAASFQRTDSLFNRQWLLTATSPKRKTVTTYDYNKSVIHREWFDHVLEYKFAEDFVYYDKGKIQFYELKNVPFKHQTQKGVKTYNTLRFSNNYDRKAYFEYSDVDHITFEMNQDDFFQTNKFYYEYDINGMSSLIKHFKNSQWIWSENNEYSNNNNTTHTFLFPRGKRFPFLVENREEQPEKDIVQIEYSIIPKSSYNKSPRSRKISHLGEDKSSNRNEYWFNKPVSSFKYEFKKILSNHTVLSDNSSTKTTTLEGKVIFTETVTKDDQGRIIEYLVYSDLYNHILEKYQFKYNDHNHISNVKAFNYELASNVAIESQITFEYSYDTTGNWIKQVKSINGNPIFEWNRKITYYDPSANSR